MILAYLFGASRPSDDASRFEQEALVHLDSLYRVARRMSGNETEAEDLVQETMVRAFRFFHQFQTGTNCRAWLMRILHNVHLNVVGRKGRAPVTTSMDATEEHVLYAHLAQETGPGPEDEVMATVWDDKVLAALDRLPLEFREVVVMCDVEEMAYKDIAQALDIPIGTVRSRIARGRGMLARFLSETTHRRS